MKSPFNPLFLLVRVSIRCSRADGDEREPRFNEFSITFKSLNFENSFVTILLYIEH